jgi:uncharacterized membrane protein HdeD (DUF308 family)
MNIRVRAALYAISYFVGIFLIGIGLNTIMPYLEAWMGWTVLFGVLFYMIYSLMLTKLEGDAMLNGVKKEVDKAADQ